MMDADSDSETSDEEKQLEELRQLEKALAEDDDDLPATRDLSKLSAKDQKRYDDIRSAIGINKLLNEKLINFEKQLVARLKECRERIAAIHSDTKNKATEKTQVFRYVVCGKPYFKDRDYFSPPDNQDTITMRKSGMYDFSEPATVSGWTVKDKSQFLEQVLKMSREIKKDELSSKLAELKRQKLNQADSRSPIESRRLKKEIRYLERQINGLNKLPLTSLVKPLEEEYDWDAIADALNNRHTAKEYRALWRLFLHPSINKKSWSRQEHSKLTEIIHEHRLQDWDSIAKKLDTGRTAYQCFVYFRTTLNNALLGSKWTKEEEEYLRRLIDYYREDDYIPWGRVAASMENRTKTQIYNKFKRLNEVRKGRFLQEEDVVLLTCVDHFGPNWQKVITYMPGRSIDQVRKRYQVLNNSKASVVWTPDEDKKLLKLIANQDAKLLNYSTLTEHFPTKTRSQLRARHLTLVKWMKRHPNKDIELAPRRGARRLTHGESLKDLGTAVETLKKRLQSELETVKTKKINIESPESTIDHALSNYVLTEKIRDEALKKQASNESSVLSNGRTTHQKAVQDLRNSLMFLRAKLNKDLFKASEYNFKYPGLTEEEVQKSYVKLKCYSKKNVTNLIAIDNEKPAFNIWGNPLPPTNYVLSPNYSTLIGCMRLMAAASDMKPQMDHCINVIQLVRRNPLAKQQLELFMARFTCLFLWPMLLSNVNPKTSAIGKKYADRPGLKFDNKWGKLYQCPSVLEPSEETATSTNDNETIDLDEDESVDDRVLIVKRYIGNDDFLYLDSDSGDSSEDSSDD